MDIQGNENLLWLIFVALFVLVPAYVYCFWRKAGALRVLASLDMLKKINVSVSFRRQILKAVILLTGFIVIVIALIRPVWNPQSKQISRSGRDVVILLDTSRSMLAEDLRPSRLERAKIAISDLIEVLEGDRISLITFAGNSSVKCPLTQDYAFFRMALADVSTSSNAQGGTVIGDAIRLARTEVFDSKSRKYKDIILITDGEDQDSFPVQAAAKAAEDGVRIIAIGLGDKEQGARIPITDQYGQKSFLKYQGQEVWSRLEGDKLLEIVYATTDGKYLEVGKGDFDLGQIYTDLIATAEKRELESTTLIQYDEKFQIFLALAIVLIAAEVFISERKKA